MKPTKRRRWLILTNSQAASETYDSRRKIMTVKQQLIAEIERIDNPV